MKKCKICFEYITKYEDMKKYKDFIIIPDPDHNDHNDHNDILSRILNIIRLRQQCIDIYKKYENCCRSIERHQYVVDIYSDIVTQATCF